ncbi:MAG TPA: carbohydrate kinase family protein, partial [Acidimicrobiales bacterium]|nr:carbohydrate kinase family protein [Acidimicrobiales bacterium]
LRAASHVSSDLTLEFVSVVSDALQSVPWVEEEVADLRRKVGVTLVEVPGRPNTCVSVLEQGERTLTTYNDTSVSGALSQADVFSQVLRRLVRGRIAYFTSIFGDAAIEDVRSLILAVRAANDRVIVCIDPGHVWAGFQATRKLLSLADVVFVNEAELALLTPIPKAQGVAGEVERCGELLRDGSDRRRGVVVLKKSDPVNRSPHYVGEVGGAMYWSDSLAKNGLRRVEFLREALASAAIRDSTGAGDVFAAGVIAALESREAAARSALRIAVDAANHRLQRPGLTGYQDLWNVPGGDRLPSGLGKVFISHARADADIARALEYLLNAGSEEQAEDRYFCSSIAGQGLNPGDKVHHQIWAELRSAELVVFVITPEFLESRECAYELGITAALGLRAVPLVSKGIEFADIGVPVSESFGGALWDASSLFGLYDHVHQQFRDAVAPSTLVRDRVEVLRSLVAAKGY